MDKRVNTESEFYLLNYGCGLHAPINWMNFDTSPTLRLQKIPLLGKILTKNRPQFHKNTHYGDITKKLPLRDQSCHIIYCSHVLEHLSLVDFRKALKETYRLLSSEGIFRGVIPDLEFHIKSYINDPNPNAAIRFHEETLLGVKERPNSVKTHISTLLGNSQHLWMWDYKALEQELQQAGFKNVRRAWFGDSGQNEFIAVEVKDRWDNCLGFQCTK